MPFDEKEFAKKVVNDLTLLRYDIDTLRLLTADQRKSIIKKILNEMIDIPVMPEYIEALFFGFAVEFAENFIQSKLSPKP